MRRQQPVEERGDQEPDVLDGRASRRDARSDRSGRRSLIRLDFGRKLAFRSGPHSSGGVAFSRLSGRPRQSPDHGGADEEDGRGQDRDEPDDRQGTGRQRDAAEQRADGEADVEGRPVVGARADPGLAGEGRQPVGRPADLAQLRGDLPADDHGDEGPEAVHEQPAQERHRLQRVADAPAGPCADPVGQAPEGDGDQELRRHADGEAEAGLGHGEPDDLDGVDGLPGDERAGAEREYRALDRGRPDQRVVGEHAVKEPAQPSSVGSQGMCPLCRFLWQFRRTQYRATPSIATGYFGRPGLRWLGVEKTVLASTTP